MERLRELHARSDLFDALVAAVVSVLALVEITTNPALDGNSWTLMAVASLGMTLPLALRRRAPLVAIAIVCVLVAVTGQAWDLPDEAVFPMACLLLLTYSAGANSDLRGAVTGFAIVFGLLSVGVTLEGTPEDILYVLVVCGGTWTAGRLVHARQQTADAMAGRAEIAEREREERARAAVAEERARIARELHDVVAHSISVMVVQAGAERRALGEEREDTRDVLHTIEQTGRQTLTEMRRLLGMLRRSDDEIELAPQPGMEHVDALVDQVREAGLPVTLSIEGDRSPLPAGVDLSAYRIVQEALTNALKHAGPASARVTVRYGDGELELDIVDDGAGGLNGDGGGHGLIGMRERVTMFGGALDAGARREGGYAVRARLPIAG